MGSAAIPLSFESPKFQPIDPLGASAKAMSLYSAAQGISLNQQRIAEETMRAKQLERDQRDEDIGNETLAKYDGDLEKALPELSTKVQAKNALKWRQAYRADKQAALALTREQQAAYQGYFDAHAQEDAILASLPPEERANRIPQSIAGLKLAGVPKDMIQYKEGEVPSDALLKARIVGSKVGSRIMADAQKASAIKTAETRAAADTTAANTRASAEKRAALLQTAEDVGAYLRTAKGAEDFDAKFAEAEEAHPEVIDRFPDKWSPTANDEIDAALSKGQARMVEFGKRAAQAIPRTEAQLAALANNLDETPERRAWAAASLTTLQGSINARKQISPGQQRLLGQDERKQRIDGAANRIFAEANRDVAKAKKLLGESTDPFVKQNQLSITRALQGAKADFLESFSDPASTPGTGGKPAPPKPSVKPPVASVGGVRVVLPNGEMSTVEADKVDPQSMKFGPAKGTATKAQVEAFAKRKNLKYEDAEKQVKSEGYLVK